MTGRLLHREPASTPDGERETFIIGGRSVPAAAAVDVLLPEDPPEACPDCTGPLDYAPAGNVPGCYQCADCGSLYGPAHDWTATCERCGEAALPVGDELRCTACGAVRTASGDPLPARSERAERGPVPAAAHAPRPRKGDPKCPT